jgi:Na+-driven multidrug efflux pump
MSVSFLAMGNAVGIIMGQMLGARKSPEEVKDTNRKLVTFSVLFSIFFGVLLVCLSSQFPKLYNTSDSVRHMASGFICVMAALIPFYAYTNAAYFSLRSGGKTIITFLFDSCYVWVVCVPLAFCLSRFTGLSIVPLYFVCQCTEIVKSFLGWYMLKRGDWIQNIVSETEA